MLIDAATFRDRCNVIHARHKQRVQAQQYAQGISWTDRTLGSGHYWGYGTESPATWRSIRTAKAILVAAQSYVRSSNGWLLPGESLARGRLPTSLSMRYDSTGADPNWEDILIGPGAGDVASLGRLAGLPSWGTHGYDLTRKFPATFKCPASVYGNEVITDAQLGTGESTYFDNGDYSVAWTVGDYARAMTGTLSEFGWSADGGGGYMYVRESGQWRLLSTNCNEQPTVVSAPGVVQSGDYIGDWLVDELDACFDQLTRSRISDGSLTVSTDKRSASGSDTDDDQQPPFTASWEDAKAEAESNYATNPGGGSASYSSINTNGSVNLGDNGDGTSGPVSYGANIQTTVLTLTFAAGGDPPAHTHTIRGAIYAQSRDIGGSTWNWSDHGYPVLQDSWAEINAIGGPASGDTDLFVLGAHSVPGWVSAPTSSIDDQYLGFDMYGPLAVIDWTFATPSPSPAPVPAAPSNLAATATAYNQIDLTWTDNATDEDDFQLQRREEGSTTWSTIATPAADSTSYADTTVSAETGYTYRIKARSTVGESTWSNYATATTPEAPVFAACCGTYTATIYSGALMASTDYVLDETADASGIWTDGTLTLQLTSDGTQWVIHDGADPDTPGNIYFTHTASGESCPPQGPDGWSNGGAAADLSMEDLVGSNCP